MKKIKGHIKKSYYVYALLAVIIAGCVAAGGYIKNIHADDQNYVVADEVVINGKTYTSSNKMNVLMIAPHEAYDEIGILMGIARVRLSLLTLWQRHLLILQMAHSGII